MKAKRERAQALKRGADELMNLAEYSLHSQNRPALMRVRKKYKEFCLLALRTITKSRQ